MSHTFPDEMQRAEAVKDLLRRLLGLGFDIELAQRGDGKADITVSKDGRVLCIAEVKPRLDTIEDAQSQGAVYWDKHVKKVQREDPRLLE
jgi:hypothetical protein